MTNKTYGPDKLTVDQMYSNRQVADDSGHTHYFSGVSCKHGHIAPRLVSNSKCVGYGKMHYDKQMMPKQELLRQKRQAKERIRKLQAEEES